jgi:hypothetical protein
MDMILKMKYSKKEIREELKKELDRGYDITRISNWAYNLLYIETRGQLFPEICSVLRDISVMDAGPEFEYSERELRLLAELLITEENDPIKKIDDLKAKE